MKLSKKKKIGRILVEMELIKEDELLAALGREDKRGMPLGEYLISEQKISEEDLAKVLAEQEGLKYYSFDQATPDEYALGEMSQEIIKECQALPIQMVGDTLMVGFVNATNKVKLEGKLKVAFEPVIISKRTFEHNYSFLFGADGDDSEEIEDADFAEAILEGFFVEDEKQHNVKKLMGKLEKERKEEEQRASKKKKLIAKGDDNSLEELIDSFIRDAILAKASDIHIEADNELLRIRTRVDGVLMEKESFPLELHSTIVSRIKLISGLDITEKRIPQDGRHSMEIDDKQIDLRISTLPTIKGEKVVMRILDKENLSTDLNTIGMNDKLLNQSKDLLANTSGIILITGPTGSGKTTTVYSMLNHINTMERNLVTVEDPVEFHFGLINQVQVNTKAGLTFAASLRSILRQDPDVIMVGEIRDKETAEIAIKAALTGHLVISTLHTNDSISTVQRLVDIGVEPYLLSSALLGIVAQRLVRRVCSECNEEIDDVDMAENEIEKYLLGKGKHVKRAVGCNACNDSGYRGRMPIFELFAPDQELRIAIKDGMSAIEMTDLAVENCGFETMAVDGMSKVESFHTTADDVIKQVGDISKSMNEVKAEIPKKKDTDLSIVPSEAEKPKEDKDVA